MGKLAIWRIATHGNFGGTWLSDYRENKLGCRVGQKPVVQQEKPDCSPIGQNGNVFNLMGIVSQTLKDNGFGKQAEEMCGRITSCGSYDEALCIMGEYVNIISMKDGLEQGDDFEMVQY